MKYACMFYTGEYVFGKKWYHSVRGETGLQTLHFQYFNLAWLKIVVHELDWLKINNIANELVITVKRNDTNYCEKVVIKTFVSLKIKQK